MPLIHSGSHDAFETNLKRELESGKPKAQSLAIAYSIKHKAAGEDEPKAAPSREAMINKAIRNHVHGVVKAEPVYQMSAKEAMTEHLRLLQVLASPSHKDDKAELKEQAEEMPEITEAVTKSEHDPGSPPDHDASMAQIHANNQRLAHWKIHGMDVSIENLAGSTRSGIDPDGKPWEVVMPYHYGYFRGTVGADGDHLDCAIGPLMGQGTEAHIINQKKHKNNQRFDEHKVFLGFPSREDAIRAFRLGRSDNPDDIMGSVITVPIEEMKRWIAEGCLKDEAVLKAEQIAKAHVKGHVRTIENGKTVWIDTYDTNRPGRAANLHERTAIGQHKDGSHFLRATDKDDAATIEHFSRGLNIKTDKRTREAEHLGQKGKFTHFHMNQEDAVKLHHALQSAQDAPEEARTPNLLDAMADPDPVSAKEPVTVREASPAKGHAIPAPPKALFDENANARDRAESLSKDVSKLQQEKPSPLIKMFGKNPTEAQVKEHSDLTRAWNNKFRRTHKAWIAAIDASNKEFLAKMKFEAATTDKDVPKTAPPVNPPAVTSAVHSIAETLPNGFRHLEGKDLEGKTLHSISLDGALLGYGKTKDAAVAMAENRLAPESSYGLGKTGPKEGDERTLNGRTYRLTDGRWRRVGTDGKLEKLGEGGWISEDAAAASAGLPPESSTKKPALPPHLQDAAKKMQAAIDRGEAPALAKKIVNAAHTIQDVTPEEFGPEPASPKPAQTPAATSSDATSTDDPASMRARLTIQEPEGNEFEKKYGITFVSKDGKPIAKIAKWTKTATGTTVYSIEDLKVRKKRSLFDGTAGEIIPACATVEDAMDKYAMKLFAEEQDAKAKDAASKERAKAIRDSKRANAIANATPANRQEATKAAFDEPEEDAEPPKPEPYDFTPGTAHITAGGISQTMPDFTAVIPRKVILANRKTVLDQPRPSWIPEVSERLFNVSSGRIEGIKVGEDRYVIATDRVAAQSDFARGIIPATTSYAVVNLATLVATQDYYSKRRQAKHDRLVDTSKAVWERTVSVMKWIQENKAYGPDAQRILDDQAVAERLMPGLNREQMQSIIKPAVESVNQWRVYGRGRSLDEYAAEEGKTFEKRVKKERPKTINSDRMTYAHEAMIRNATSGGKTRTNAWKEFHAYMDDLTQASSDMQLQMEENTSTYSKGRETSYGRAGSVKDILPTHGVTVKRQNGDAITPFELDEVKQALDSVYGVYGDRSELAKRAKLLISHSGDVLMHASKASGIYCPGRNAIGVTWQGGQLGAGFTLAHEFAHFMDDHIAQQTGKYHYASDDRNGIENRIASTFRKHMAKTQKSDYQNRTCECFARAMEQYYATATGQHELYQHLWNADGNHPTQADFETHLKPLIDRFMEEKVHVLKALPFADAFIQCFA